MPELFPLQLLLLAWLRSDSADLGQLKAAQLLLLLELLAITVSSSEGFSTLLQSPVELSNLARLIGEAPRLVEKTRMGGFIEERLVLVLAAQIDEEGAYFLETSQGEG